MQHRRMEMMDAALAINGRTIANRKPAIDGLWNTFIHKVSRKDLITNVKTSPTTTKAILDIEKKTVKSVEVGKLKDFKHFCAEGTNEMEDGIVEVYKELEPHLLTLASLYFAPEDAKIVNVLWFGKQNHFKVTIGADGAPFGKNDEATAWLISFMNTGTRVASCYDNFLLCGANCSESCDAMV